jgi:hypothetical protein
MRERYQIRGPLAIDLNLSRFEALLPHVQLRLTFGKMQLPIIH